MEDRAREQRLRRLAKRQGFSIVKSRSRTPEDPSYCGYMIVNSNNLIEYGAHPNAFSLSLDEVEEFLS